jgi:hypothetical protein
MDCDAVDPSRQFEPAMPSDLARCERLVEEKEREA